MGDDQPTCDLTAMGREREREDRRLRAMEKRLLAAVLSADPRRLPQDVAEARGQILAEFDDGSTVS